MVITCSLYIPMPPLCAMAANHFRMRSDLQDCSEAAEAVIFTAVEGEAPRPDKTRALSVVCCVLCVSVVSSSPRL
jgi:hypothetical protein